MRTLQIKKDMMELKPYTYVVWLVGMFSGCVAYLNTPAFMNAYLLGIASFLSNLIGVIWGVVIAFIMGAVAVLANKVTETWWEKRGKAAYVRFITKKRKRKNNGKV